MSATPVTEQLSEQTQRVLEAIRANPHTTEYSEEELSAAYKEATEKLNVFRARGGKAESAVKKWVNVSVTNLARQYERYLQITGITAYLYQMAHEHFRRDADLYRDPEEAERVVYRFLNHFLQFNPNQHVAKLRKRNPSPEEKAAFGTLVDTVHKRARAERAEPGSAGGAAAYTEEIAKVEKRLAELAEKAEAAPAADKKALFKQSRELEGVKAALESHRTAALQLSESPANPGNQTVPHDFQYWYTSYFESNYQAIREATEALYPVRSFLDEMIIVYDGMYTDKAKADVARRALGSEDLIIRTMAVDAPTFYGPFKENILGVHFRGETDAIFRQVMDLQEEESRMAEQMMRKVREVRQRRAGFEVANPEDERDFKTFLNSLRESERPLTKAEQAVLEQADAEDEQKLRTAVRQVRSEREEAAFHADSEALGANETGVHISGVDPDTGEFVQGVGVMAGRNS